MSTKGVVVEGSLVKLRLPGGRSIEIEPTISVESGHVPSVGFCDSSSVTEGGIEHEFGLFVGVEDFPKRRAMRICTELASVAEEPTKIFDGFSLQLGYLKILEFPIHYARGNRTYLWEWLDQANDLTSSSIPDAALHVNERGEGLEGGSLLWLRLLGVHPAARGSSLGLRLIAHALWVLYRSVEDTAFLDVSPTGTVFDGPQAPEPPDQAMLIRYYSRLGFRVADEGQDRPVMYASVLEALSHTRVASGRR